MKKTSIYALILFLSLGACKKNTIEEETSGGFNTQGASHANIRVEATGLTTDYSPVATVRLGSISSNSVMQETDVVYAMDIAREKIRKILADPNSGNTQGTFNTVRETDIKSAALGADGNGWLYFLNYGQGAEGEGDGKVDVYAIKADGSGSPIRIINNFDVNGSSKSELGFVRLGVTKNNIAYILAKGLSSNKLCLARFNCEGGSSIDVNPMILSTDITTSDNNNGVFENGDLCFDGNGIMYVLGNHTGSSSTKIYTIDPTMNNVLQHKWTLKKDNGHHFTGTVNGCAFSSTGSMYISTSDGLYFIDQYTTNFAGSGTILCSKKKDYDDLSDLATAYWPAHTAMPVTFTSLRAEKVGNAIQVQFEVTDVVGVEFYNIQISIDGGKKYWPVRTIKADQVQPNRVYTETINIVN